MTEIVSSFIKLLKDHQKLNYYGINGSESSIPDTILIKLSSMLKISSKYIIPVLENKSDKCGVFKFEVNEYTNDSLDIYVESCFADMAWKNGYAIYDWHFIYTENNFCDNDSAGLLYNCNTTSPFYGRIIVYESFDAKHFTLLRKECTITRVYDEYDKFTPVEHSYSCSASYFVSYLAEKYKEDATTDY